jgi:hypothetical protein
LPSDTAEEADRKEEERGDELEGAEDDDADQAEGEEDEPDEGIEDECGQGQGPADDEKDAEEQKFEHESSFIRGTQNGKGWFRERRTNREREDFLTKGSFAFANDGPP